jgi:hypothetical protein
VAVAAFAVGETLVVADDAVPVPAAFSADGLIEA